MGRGRIVLIRADKFRTHSSDFVGIHIVILPGVGLSDVAPRSRLPYCETEFLIDGRRFREIVDRHANMLDAFPMQLQEVCINIRWSGRRLNPLKTNSAHPLKADFKR
jgi:hypothetical protein